MIPEYLINALADTGATWLTLRFRDGEVSASLPGIPETGYGETVTGAVGELLEAIAETLDDVADYAESE